MLLNIEYINTSRGLLFTNVHLKHLVKLCRTPTTSPLLQPQDVQLTQKNPFKLTVHEEPSVHKDEEDDGDETILPPHLHIIYDDLIDNTKNIIVTTNHTITTIPDSSVDDFCFQTPAAGEPLLNHLRCAIDASNLAHTTKLVSDNLYKISSILI